MKAGRTFIAGILGGAILTVGGVLMAGGNQSAPACISSSDVAVLVDGCMRGNREICALMDRNVSASCLMKRALEAGEAKRPKPAEIT